MIKLTTNECKVSFGGAAIAQWIHLRLSSCRPGFESQAFHLCFFINSIWLYLSFEKNENKQKEAVFGPFFKISEELVTFQQVSLHFN